MPMHAVYRSDIKLPACNPNASLPKPSLDVYSFREGIALPPAYGVATLTPAFSHR